MAWNRRSDETENVSKYNPNYGFNKAWMTMYDDSSLFRPCVTGFTAPIARFPNPSLSAYLDAYDDALDLEGSGADDYASQGHKKRKLTVDQAKTLETSFERDNKLEAERKKKLAKELGLHPRQVAVWFQNRRARWKTKRLEQEYVTLKSEFDTVVAESEKLKAEVARLTKELKGRNPKRPELTQLSDIDEESEGKLETLLEAGGPVMIDKNNNNSRGSNNNNNSSSMEEMPWPGLELESMDGDANSETSKPYMGLFTDGDQELWVFN